MQLEQAMEIALVLGRVKVVHALEDFRKRRAAGQVRRISKKSSVTGGNATNDTNGDMDGMRRPGMRPRLQV